MTNGVVTSITFTGGSGYVAAPTVTIALPPQTVNLTGISPGLGDTGQTVTIMAASSNPQIIPTPTISYTNPATTGTLSFTPVLDATGSSLITVTVTDNAGLLSTQRTFTVNVISVNQAPTLSCHQQHHDHREFGAAVDRALGITNGDPNSGQSLTVTAASSNPALIPNPAVTYTSPSTTGTLTYTSAPNATGTAVVTVTVTDSGGTANGGVNSVSQTFTITVLPVNQPPTLNVIPNPAAIFENSSTQNILLGGITAGPGQSETVTVSASSNNPGLIPNPTDRLHQPRHGGHAELHAGAVHQRNRRHHRHRDEQRRHRGRRPEHLPAHLHGGGHAGQPAAHARLRSAMSRSSRVRGRQRPPRRLPAVRSAGSRSSTAAPATCRRRRSC